MQHKERIPTALFNEDGHYDGRPADFDDRIVQRRVRLTKAIPNFLGKDNTLLDIGCGNGASMFLLSNDMKACSGIDITDEHYDLFKAYKDKNNIDNCDFSIKNIVEEKATKQYDRIISFEVIEHLSDESGVQYYFDSLKDDGMIAISVPNKWWIFETHGAKLPLLPWNRVPLFSWLPRPIHEKFSHARIYTKTRIRKLLEKHGFEVVESKYIMAPMDVLPDGKFKNWVIKNVFNKDVTNNPFKSTSVFVVARKKTK